MSHLEIFDIDAANAGEDKLKSETWIHLIDGDMLLQTVGFHTSCSQPLHVGDQFGASLLVGCLGENEAGALAPPSSEVVAGVAAAVPDVPATLAPDAPATVDDVERLLASWGECARCPWDLDGDDNVGINDLLDLLADWGSPYGINDLLDLLAAWGPCP